MGTLAMFLCVIGAVSIIRGIALRLSIDNNQGRIYGVVLNKEPDIQLQMLVETIGWDRTFKSAKVFAIDGGIPAEMVEHCRNVCKNNGIEFLEQNETEGLLSIFEK